MVRTRSCSLWSESRRNFLCSQMTGYGTRTETVTEVMAPFELYKQAMV